MKQLSSLSIFFPAYNDAKIIPYLVIKAEAIAKKITSDYEIIIVNDGSQDESEFIFSELEKKYDKVKVVTHSKNKGYGGALISGFSTATKEWIFYTDGDGQYDPLELELLVDKVSDQIDVVNGFKKDRGDDIDRRMLGDLYNKGLHSVVQLPISDVDCDFRLIRHSLIQKIELHSLTGNICFELVSNLQKVGARFVEVPVSHYRRAFGRSQFYTLRNIYLTLIENIKTIYKMKFKK